MFSSSHAPALFRLCLCVCVEMHGEFNLPTRTILSIANHFHTISWKEKKRFLSSVIHTVSFFYSCHIHSVYTLFSTASYYSRLVAPSFCHFSTIPEWVFLLPFNALCSACFTIFSTPLPLSLSPFSHVNLNLSNECEININNSRYWQSWNPFNMRIIFFHYWKMSYTHCRHRQQRKSQ